MPKFKSGNRVKVSVNAQTVPEHRGHVGTITDIRGPVIMRPHTYLGRAGQVEQKRQYVWYNVRLDSISLTITAEESDLRSA